jgi:hypothetical protein
LSLKEQFSKKNFAKIKLFYVWLTFHSKSKIIPVFCNKHGLSPQKKINSYSTCFWLDHVASCLNWKTQQITRNLHVELFDILSLLFNLINRFIMQKELFSNSKIKDRLIWFLSDLSQYIFTIKRAWNFLENGFLKIFKFYN